MKFSTFYPIAALVVVAWSCENNQQTSENMYQTLQATDKNGMTYEYVSNDPMGVRIYTLSNGLKVYLTQNKNEPTIQTLIAVRAGSTYDPKETTGLAHYLEHMMFKGTSRLGTKDWEKEQAVLSLVSDAFERHKNETDPEKKKKIYREIDSLSVEAAKYAIANEYDKAVSGIGGKNTNAFTSNEQTVYLNTIPANELERWLKLERERFGELVLRIFHTELETVYEEFNRAQDNDYRKIYYLMYKNLFPGHPYGEQTTIGEAAHLKNPSMVNIHNYWNTYYKSNNMAICMSGDFDYDEAIKLIQDNWGDLEPAATFPEREKIELQPITAPVIKEISGPDQEMITLSWRLDGVRTSDEKLGTIFGQLLSNGKAGLIDLNLVQKQKLLETYANVSFLKEYGYLQILSTLREGQQMEEARDLILGEIEKIKKGEFDQETFDAIINNLRRDEIQKRESNFRAYDLMGAFIDERPWIEQVQFLDELAKITRKELIAFANNKFKDNYVAIYKRTGNDTSAIKVEKPQITSLKLNKDEESAWLQQFNAIPTPEITPVFIDFEKDIQKTMIAQKAPLYYIKNEDSELFRLYYILEMGSINSKEMALGFELLPFLGTDKYSPESLRKEFYKHGLEMEVYASSDRTYIYVSGLKKSTEKGIELLEHVLGSIQPDTSVYAEFVNGILKKREDTKKNKGSLTYWAMPNYAKYGPKNAVTDILDADALKAMDPNNLTALVKNTTGYEHIIHYYGQDDIKDIAAMLEKHHNMPATLSPVPPATDYPELEQNEHLVYFVHRDQVQAEMLLISRDVPFEKTLLPWASLYNNYYGSGLSSIVFQEIREAKALAYTAYAYYSTPSKPTESHYTTFYIGTQADKFHDAFEAANEILTSMPKVDNQFEATKRSTRKIIASDRKVKSAKFFTFLNNKRLGIDYDIRKDYYDLAGKANLEEMEAFFNAHIKGKRYTMMVLADRNRLKPDDLRKYGKVTELSLEDLFGY
jgi:predicted Zn-dependent peptidase